MPHNLYTSYADWWPLVSHPEDYADDAEFYAGIMLDACAREPESVLELGCGGGNNASHLKRRFQMTLTDLSAEMLEVSRKINPECDHAQGDMRTIRLGKTFDVVFTHDAVIYMTTLDDIKKVAASAWDHCNTGGCALFVPDYTKDTFRESTYHGGGDGPDRAMRYLEWDWDPDPSDTTYNIEFNYVFRAPDGSLTREHETHLCGLFTNDEWLDAISSAGFDPHVVTLDSPDLNPGAYQVFVGKKS